MSETKTCKKCNQTLPLTEFKKTWNGYLMRSCWKCARRSRSDQNLRLTFGISRDDFDAMYSEQNGCCAICQTPEPSGRYDTFNVDHDHDTGKVRGLLCRKCNMSLGGFGDNISTLQKAIDYLKSHET